MIQSLLNQTAKKFIKKWEGVKLEPYKCPGGVWTIGWGHTQGVTGKSPRISLGQAEKLLYDDLMIVQNTVRKHVHVRLTENQEAALMSFVFNLGETRFRKSTLLALLNQGSYFGAANCFKDWVKAKGKIIEGLVNRRKAEEQLFLAEQLVADNGKVL